MTFRFRVATGVEAREESDEEEDEEAIFAWTKLCALGSAWQCSLDEKG
jgi:hypothetical protein